MQKVEISPTRFVPPPARTTAETGGSIDGTLSVPASVRAQPTYEIKLSSHVYGKGLSREGWDAASSQEFDLTLVAREPIGAPLMRKPAVLLIHGGGFVDGNAGAMQGLGNFFASRGWIAFSINYRKEAEHGSLPRLWPPTSCASDDERVKQWWRVMRTFVKKGKKMYPAARDAKAAVRWIHANAQQFGVHEDSIVAVGHSAGGFLSCMLGLTEPGDYRDEISTTDDPTLLTTNLDARSDVAASVVLAGSPALVHLLHVRDGRSRFDSLKARGQRFKGVLIVHGDKDAVVPHICAVQLVDLCEQSGALHQLVTLPGAGHNFPYRAQSQATQLQIYRFIVERLRLTVESEEPPEAPDPPAAGTSTTSEGDRECTDDADAPAGRPLCTTV